MERAPRKTASRPADRDALTARELEVLGLMAEGHTNREIAEALFISAKTAGVHVGNILSKLRARGRVEAVTVALRTGLVGAAGGARADAEMNTQDAAD